MMFDAIETIAWFFMYTIAFAMSLVVVMLIGGVISLWAPLDPLALFAIGIAAGLSVCTALERTRPK